MVDRNEQRKNNVDFTPAAHKHLFGSISGKQRTSFARDRETKIEETKLITAQDKIFAAAGWEALVPIHDKRDIEIKICIGDVDDIKAMLNIGKTTNTGGLG